MGIFFFGLVCFVLIVGYIVWDIRQKSDSQNSRPTQTTSGAGNPPPTSSKGGTFGGWIKVLIAGLVLIFVVIPFCINLIKGLNHTFGISQMVRDPDRLEVLEFNKGLIPGINAYQSGNQTTITITAPPDAHIVMEQDGQGGVKSLGIKYFRIQPQEIPDFRDTWDLGEFKKVVSIEQLPSVVMLHTNRRESSLVVYLPDGIWSVAQGEKMRQFSHNNDNLEQKNQDPKEIGQSLAKWDENQNLLEMAVNPKYLKQFGVALQDPKNKNYNFFTNNTQIDIQNFFARFPKGKVVFRLPIRWTKASQGLQSLDGKTRLDGMIAIQIVVEN